MYPAYFLLFLAFIGIVEVLHARYFSAAVSAHDAGIMLGDASIVQAMKEAVFGAGGEVHREAPWTLFISNYMFMIYTGSGIIFLVSLAELSEVCRFDLCSIKETAAGFMTLGLVMILAGLFTIMMDLNLLHMQWMFLSANLKSGMWLMLPLYAIYIPFVIYEIYLIISQKEKSAKKMAIILLIFSLLVEIVEFYVQAKLFNMNAARHLWTMYPLLTLYFMISSLAASAGVMILYSYLVYYSKLNEEFHRQMQLLKKVALIGIVTLGAYEAIAYLIIDQKWSAVIFFGEYKYYVYAYPIIAIGIPFILLFKSTVKNSTKVIAALFIVVGSYIGRILFVYGGNAYPMSERFGVGFEKYREYEAIKSIILFPPSMGEIFVVIGSFGVALFLYHIADALFAVSKVRK